MLSYFSVVTVVVVFGARISSLSFFLLPTRAVLDSVSSTRFHSLLACVVMVSFVEHAVADECCLICHSWQPSWVSQIHFSSKYVQFDLAAFISVDCRLLYLRLYYHRILLLSQILHLLMLSFSVGASDVIV